MQRNQAKLPVAAQNRQDDLPVRASRFPIHRKQRPVPVGAVQKWRLQAELTLEFFGFPRTITTREVWELFSQYGHPTSINLFVENEVVSGGGRVRFNPAPQLGHRDQISVYVKEKLYNITFRVRPLRDMPLVPGLVDPTKQYPQRIYVKGRSLGFGTLSKPCEMLSMFETEPAHGFPIEVKLNLEHRELDFNFPIAFDDPNGQLSRTNGYSLQIPLCQRILMYKIDKNSPDELDLVIWTESTPKWFRIYDHAKTHSDAVRVWCDRKSHYRQVDVVLDMQSKAHKTKPITLANEGSLVQIGRWTTFHISIDRRGEEAATIDLFCRALRDYNINIVEEVGFHILRHNPTPVWTIIDNTSAVDFHAPSPLHFNVRYLLEVCLSGGWLSEYDLSEEFVDRLRSMDPDKACALLEDVAIDSDSAKGRRVFDPMSIFSRHPSRKSVSNKKIPAWATLMRSAIITPTGIVFNPPSWEISNRVLRYFAGHNDRFLRVRFTDEKGQGRIFSQVDEDTMNEVFTRIKRAFSNGITIGDRHYEFLAFGNSQFRENGAYFFAATGNLDAAVIRRWMGDFTHIRCIAKYAARLGQCFSTTRAVQGAKPNMSEIPDVWTANRKHNFTDGVGKISPLLALMAANDSNLPIKSGEVPSVFQFRCGGSKGVLAVDPKLKGLELHFRKSQHKFDTRKDELEIIRWSQVAEAALNRQFIAVLSSLGVPDEIFLAKMRQQLARLDQAMMDQYVARDALLSSIDHNQMTPVLATMIDNGFQRVEEPFMLSLLRVWRAWSIKFLKEKAKIQVRQGAVLLGCTDETRTLQGHFEGLQHKLRNENVSERVKALPEVYVQITNFEDSGHSKVIEGPLVLARNPSLHPGDIRVVKGVNIPELAHLRDVIVLPQTGDRDVANMCSGGDLDGDDFFVSWDSELLPREWNCQPMDFTPLPPAFIKRDVVVDDISTFFVQYMKNDTLGTIAYAHLATADVEPDGVKSMKCLRLALLHSNAVDYCKSGRRAEMASDLRPKKWPHFMGKKASRSYRSQKVLGKLYDAVQKVDFKAEYETPFDSRILTAGSWSTETIAAVRELKRQYDAAIRRVMSQYDIQTEFEVWSTFVIEHIGIGSDFKFQEIIGNSISALKDRFREECIARAGSRDYAQLGSFVAAMYKITADEVAQALDQCGPSMTQSGLSESLRTRTSRPMPLISFPWLFPEVLGRIATRGLGNVVPGPLAEPATTQSKPVQTPTSKPSESTDQGKPITGTVLEPPIEAMKALSMVESSTALLGTGDPVEQSDSGSVKTPVVFDSDGLAQSRPLSPETSASSNDADNESGSEGEGEEVIVTGIDKPTATDKLLILMG